jgi:hypothetical protein
MIACGTLSAALLSFRLRWKRVLERARENALAHEQREAGLAAKQQRGFPVTCDGVVVGKYAAVLIAERVLFVE